MTDRHWRMVWTAWAAAFAVAEYTALKSGNPRAPLSYFLRRTLGIKRRPLHKRAGQVALGAGVVWLTVHLHSNEGEG